MSCNKKPKVNLKCKCESKWEPVNEFKSVLYQKPDWNCYKAQWFIIAPGLRHGGMCTDLMSPADVAQNHEEETRNANVNNQLQRQREVFRKRFSLVMVVKCLTYIYRWRKWIRFYLEGLPWLEEYSPTTGRLQWLCRFLESLVAKYAARQPK